MHFTLATVITALPLFIAVAPQPTKHRGTAVPLSKHSSLVMADQSVNFEALNSHIAATTVKILHVFGNFEKNTGASHSSAMKGTWKRNPIGLPLISLDDPLYRSFRTISIGTPPRNFAVLFDTGSRHVPLIWCTYDQNFTLNFSAATLFCQVLSVTTPVMAMLSTILKHH
ncbi:hypothetical protein BS17DRAFT_769409 [Gyrodon lividus]|nr:hypothetical protein BS17DRAFT_769409 [Gyrodon lividus]